MAYWHPTAMANYRDMRFYHIQAASDGHRHSLQVLDSDNPLLSPMG